MVFLFFFFFLNHRRKTCFFSFNLIPLFKYSQLSHQICCCCWWNVKCSKSDWRIQTVNRLDEYTSAVWEGVWGEPAICVGESVKVADSSSVWNLSACVICCGMLDQENSRLTQRSWGRKEKAASGAMTRLGTMCASGCKATGKWIFYKFMPRKLNAL